MGGRTNRMVGNEIYDQVITAMNWPFASAMAVGLIVIVIVLLASSLALGRYLERRASARVVT
jgi:ABC-type spermidine/putrescine transport system permease subunit I